MASPFENITNLMNTMSGTSFPCTCKEISAPYEFRTALVEVTGSPGAYDAHAGGADPIKYRTVTLQIIHVYRAGETYSSVWGAFDAVCALGQSIELTMRDAAGATWYQQGRVQRVDKKEALTDVGSVEIPVTFLFPNPFWSAKYKSGILRADTGLFANTGLLADQDPDRFPITGQTTSHIVANSGYAPDLAPTIVLTGPLPAPIAIANNAVLIRPGQGMALVYTHAILAGETVTIDCAQLDVSSTNTAVYAYQYLNPLQPGQDRWFQIAAGNNQIVINTGSPSCNAGTATINWSPKKI